MKNSDPLTEFIKIWRHIVPWVLFAWIVTIGTIYFAQFRSHFDVGLQVLKGVLGIP